MPESKLATVGTIVVAVEIDAKIFFHDKYTGVTVDILVKRNVTIKKGSQTFCLIAGQKGLILDNHTNNQVPIESVFYPGSEFEIVSM